jgi:hypothetical protein
MDRAVSGAACSTSAPAGTRAGTRAAAAPPPPPRRRGPPLRPLRRASPPRATPADDALAAEFARVVNEAASMAAPHARAPSPMLSPTAAVEAVLAALAAPDWPEPGAGARVAFAFSAHDPDAAPAAPPPRVRAWTAREEYLDFPAFSEALRAGPFAPMLEAEHWALVAPLLFPSRRFERRAVQAVEVSAGGRARRFSFCLERSGGALKDCWLVVGVRLGDYSAGGEE